MPRVPSSLVRNWRLKLAALGLSIFLWALVQTEPLSQETFSSVPVLVDVVDTSWTTSGAPVPQTVELRLGGPAREIIRLAREGTSVRVPVSAVGSRDTVIELQRDWVQLGQRPGVTVETISPATLRVAFEPAVTKSVGVSMRIQGELPSHLALSSELEVNPETVVVRGPESRLSGVESIPLTPLDLRRIEDSEIVTLPVDTTGLAATSVVPPEVVVALQVEPRIERVLEGEVVRADVRNPDVHLAVEPPTIRLRLVGARTIVTTLDLSLLRVSVPPSSLAGMAPGEERIVRVQIDGVPSLVTVQPATDVVTVRRLSAQPTGAEQGPA
jgi:hypothetical protein